MVKFGRKFFFEKVYTKKNYTVPIVIISVLVVATIVTLIAMKIYKSGTNPTKKKPVNNVPVATIQLKKDISVEVNTKLPTIEEYIKNYKNITLEEIAIVYSEDLVIKEDKSTCENEEDKDCVTLIPTNIGEFNVTFKSDKLKDVATKIKVVDTTAPTFTLKNITILEGDSYTANDFIESCNDNSNTDCTIEFYKGDKDEAGNEIKYDNLTQVGTHTIKVVAKDNSNNIAPVQEAKLIIKKKSSTSEKPQPPTEKPQSPTCKYGNLKYSDSYVIAMGMKDGDCAVSPKKADGLTKEGTIANQMLITDLQKLVNELKAKNLEGEVNIIPDTNVIYNSSKKGIVGYYVSFEVKQTINGTTTTIVRYFLNEDGNRVFKINSLNLK